MSDIFVSWGDNGSCYECFGNSYTLNDLQIAKLPTPEPNFKYFTAGILLFIATFAVGRRW
jgi:hypothetical protein